MLKAIDLFAGAGGFSLGLRRAGFEIVLANELSVDAEWTYRYNILTGQCESEFPERPSDPTVPSADAYRTAILEQMLRERVLYADSNERRMRGGDIRSVLSNKWLRSWVGCFREDIDLLVAGPPCQGFSFAGRACSTDERNELVHEIVRVAGIVQPRIVIVENVPGMLSKHAHLICDIGLSLSHGLNRMPGYYVFAELVHAESLGVPQTRRRILLVAIRRDLIHHTSCERAFKLIFPIGCPVSRPIDGRFSGRFVQRGSTLCAEEILGDLARVPPSLRTRKSWTQSYSDRKCGLSQFRRELRLDPRDYCGGRSSHSDRRKSIVAYFNHEASSHSPNVANRFRLLRKAAESSPDAEENRCNALWLQKKFSSQFPELVTRKTSQNVLLPEKWPMLTVTSLPDDIVHHSENRIPTVRESARLQTFPDWFEFKGVRTTGADRRRLGINVPQYTQVANAVPPRFAHAVAARIRQFLLLAEEDPYCLFEPDGGYYVSPNSNGIARSRLDHISEVFRSANARPIRRSRLK